VRYQIFYITLHYITSVKQFPARTKMIDFLPRHQRVQGSLAIADKLCHLCANIMRFLFNSFRGLLSNCQS